MPTRPEKEQYKDRTRWRRRKGLGEVGRIKALITSRSSSQRMKDSGDLLGFPETSLPTALITFTQESFFFFGLSSKNRGKREGGRGSNTIKKQLRKNI